MTQTTFGEMAKLLVGFPVDFLTKKLRISRATAFAWRGGGALPPATRLEAIARATGLELDRLRTAYGADIAARKARKAAAR